MLTIISFIVTLGLLVTIHEYGHFIVARFFDVKVLRFSIGFGKPFWQTTFGKDKTELVFAAIPLGGYVKMLDENELHQDAETSNLTHAYSEQTLSRAYNRLHVFKRMAIVLAGPGANLLLAIVLYWGLISLGVVGLKPLVGEVLPDTAAAIAGFHQGDDIKQINNQNVDSWQDARWKLLNTTTDNQPIAIQVVNQSNARHVYLIDTTTVKQGHNEKDLMEQLGLMPTLPTIQPILGEIIKGGAAERAGLLHKDSILSVNNYAVITWKEFVKQVRNNPNQALTLTIKRNQQTLNVQLTPAAIQEGEQTIGKIGAGVYVSKENISQYFVTTHYSLIESLFKATEKTWETSTFSLKMMGNMLIGNVSWKMMSGPVTIANYAGKSANMGIKTFISFLALISISIGIINLLPIPVLDGGHFMYYVIEFITGKPVSEGFMLAGQKIGILLIGSMMILAFYNDINRLITG